MTQMATNDDNRMKGVALTITTLNEVTTLLKPTTMHEEVIKVIIMEHIAVGAKVNFMTGHINRHNNHIRILKDNSSKGSNSIRRKSLDISNKTASRVTKV
jgi:hypothetical protein